MYDLRRCEEGVWVRKSGRQGGQAHPSPDAYPDCTAGLDRGARKEVWNFPPDQLR
jgi:hypothetical protein